MRTDIYERTGVDIRTDIYERTGVDIRTGVEVFFKYGARVDYPNCWCDFSNIDNGIVLVRQNNQAVEAYVNWAEVVRIEDRTGKKCFGILKQ